MCGPCARSQGSRCELDTAPPLRGPLSSGEGQKKEARLCQARKREVASREGRDLWDEQDPSGRQAREGHTGQARDHKEREHVRDRAGSVSGLPEGAACGRVRHGAGGGRAGLGWPAKDSVWGCDQLPGLQVDEGVGESSRESSVEAVVTSDSLSRGCSAVLSVPLQNQAKIFILICWWCTAWGGHHSGDDKLASVLLSWPRPLNALSKPSLSQDTGLVKCRWWQRWTLLCGQNRQSRTKSSKDIRGEFPGKGEHPQS